MSGIMSLPESLFSSTFISYRANADELGRFRRGGIDLVSDKVVCRSAEGECPVALGYPVYRTRGCARTQESAFIYLHRAVACLRLVPVSGSKIALRLFGGMNHTRGSKEIDRTTSDEMHRGSLALGEETRVYGLAAFLRR